MRRLHRESHLHAGECVLPDATALRISEEHHDRVADILVDRRTMLQRDFDISVR